MTTPVARPSADGGDVLSLCDPLAEALGGLAPGECFHYTYRDAVRLAGHSCPTVAGAWLMARAALAALYPQETPVRGEVEVTLGGHLDDPSLGPMSQVLGLITGAAGDSGFAGLGGRWRRRGLLRFDPELDGAVRFRRTDSGAAVELRYSTAAAPRPPELATLLPVVVRGTATAEESSTFATLWQARVTAILTGDADKFITLRKVV